MGDTWTRINDPLDIFGFQGGQAAREQQERLGLEGIAEQRRQFDITQQNLEPFLQAAEEALLQQQAIAGLGDPETQQALIAQIQASPEYQETLAAGQEAILQGAAAGGGLRGGNVQRDLARFGQTALSSAIGQHYGRLGGLAGQGGSLGLGLGGLGAQTATAIQGGFGQLGSQAVQQAALEAQQKQGFVNTLAGLGGLFSGGV